MNGDTRTTLLKITLNVGGGFKISTTPTREQLSSISTVTLSNAYFAQSMGTMKLFVDPGVSVKVAFEADADGRAIAARLTTMGAQSGHNIVFSNTKIVLEGLTVVCPKATIALLGRMEHSVHTGSFVVASTGNPQGDTLPSAVGSRAMALVP